MAQALVVPSLIFSHALVVPVFTFSSGLAETCINDSSPAGVTCSALVGSENLGLVANPTLLPGVVSFTSVSSAFTYTQMDGNLGYLDLNWTGALSQPGHGGIELPFQYSFTVTENAIQPLIEIRIPTKMVHRMLNATAATK